MISYVQFVIIMDSDVGKLCMWEKLQEQSERNNNGIYLKKLRKLKKTPTVTNWYGIDGQKTERKLKEIGNLKEQYDYVKKIKKDRAKPTRQTNS